MRRPTATTVSAAMMKAPRSSSSSWTDFSAASALARASRLAQARGSSPRFGVSSTSAGRSASGSMPAWLSRPRRRGEPEARTNLGRPSMRDLRVGGRGKDARGTYRKGLGETTPLSSPRRRGPITTVFHGEKEWLPQRCLNRTGRAYGSPPSRGDICVCGLARRLSARRPALGKALADARQQAVADVAVGLQLLLAAAFDAGRILGRPVFHVRGIGVGQFQRLVVRFGRQRDDQIEVQAFPIVQILERLRFVF